MGDVWIGNFDVDDFFIGLLPRAGEHAGKVWTLREKKLLILFSVE